MWFIKVGNRVMGPFNEDEMRAKRLCKELAPFHLVSRDSIRWESAAPLIKLLDGAQPDWKRRQPAVPVPEMDRGSRTDLAPTPSVQWYYVDSSRKQLGPIPQEALRELLQTRSLSGRAQACKVGDTQWDQAQRYPELASAVPKRTKRVFAIAGIATLSVSAIVALFLLLPFGSTGDTRRHDDVIVGPTSNPKVDLDLTTRKPIVPDVANPEPPSNLTNDLLITSTEDRKKFPYAVGLVLGTFRIPRLDGTLGKKVESGTGSVFAITADGYLLTNRHVAVMGQADKQKEELCNEVKKVSDTFRAEYAQITKYRDENSKKLSKQAFDEIEAKLKELSDKLDIYNKLIKVIQDKATDIDAKLTVFMNGIPLDSKIIYISQKFDFAILKVERPNRRPFFALEANNEIEDGTDLTILGYPGIANESRSVADKAMELMNEALEIDPVQKRQNMPQLLKPSRSQGIVNRCNEDSIHTWSIEHQVPTFPGNSGSPLFTKQGVVVGIHTEGKTLEGGGAKLNIAYSVGQFRKEIEEFVPSGVVWKSK